jgi:ubiquinone/menaquinone biosynthesis C-methylase UbiE
VRRAPRGVRPVPGDTGLLSEAGLRFARVAEAYDQARPEYPSALVDAACAAAGLGAGSPVLEIGCGTGKLTRALAARGLHVDAVDPGEAMIDVNRRSLGDAAGVRFHLGRFEDVELPDHAFAAAFSATAFHWVDPGVGWSKAARVLQPGGVLALLTHVWAVTNASRVADEAFQRVLRSVDPEIPLWELRDADAIRTGAEARLDNVSELWSWLHNRDASRPEAARLFTAVGYQAVPVAHERTPAEELALLRTTSMYLGLERDKQDLLEQGVAQVMEEHGPAAQSDTFAVLVTARAAA